jgi:hypothetical protein
MLIIARSDITDIVSNVTCFLTCWALFINRNNTESKKKLTSSLIDGNHTFEGEQGQKCHGIYAMAILGILQTILVKLGDEV